MSNQDHSRREPDACGCFTLEPTCTDLAGDQRSDRSARWGRGALEPACHWACLRSHHERRTMRSVAASATVAPNRPGPRQSHPSLVSHVVGPPIEGLDRLVARWPHRNRAAELVRVLKYDLSTAMITPLATELAAITPPADLVTWVPCTPSRRLARGFDPAELLARALARRLGLRTRRCLKRLDDDPQTGRDRPGRLEGPRLRPSGQRLGGRVLVIDDVCTTGSTLRTAAATLRSAGADAVVAAVVTIVVRN